MIICGLLPAELAEDWPPPQQPAPGGLAAATPPQGGSDGENEAAAGSGGSDGKNEAQSLPLA